MTKQSTATSIQEAVYNELKRGIMTLRLVPGTVMSTQEMATRLNVSRTPVREAFLRLQREGLVETIPQRETIVSRINLQRMKQECFIRYSLEENVIASFIASSVPDDFDRLRKNIMEQKEICQRKGYAEFIACDGQFHKIFFDVAGQNLAWDLIANNNGHYNRIRVLVVQTENTMQEVISQHEALVSLLEKGEIAQARSLLSHHLLDMSSSDIEFEKRYPDYFVRGDETFGFHIGSL